VSGATRRHLVAGEGERLGERPRWGRNEREIGKRGEGGGGEAPLVWSGGVVGSPRSKMPCGSGCPEAIAMRSIAEAMGGEERDSSGGGVKWGG
jgi:hypothetical protein